MKIRQILSIGCFLWILASLRLAAQQPEIQPLPIDPKIRYGQLNNGLTYYIRHNAQPKDRADFFIAQNVGSTKTSADWPISLNTWRSTEQRTSQGMAWMNLPKASGCAEVRTSTLIQVSTKRST